MTFPSLDSTSNMIHLEGQAEQVEGLKKDLIESYEKYQADQKARSYELRFTVKPGISFDYYRILSTNNK